MSKCSRCKTEKDVNAFGYKINGQMYKLCIACRNKQNKNRIEKKEKQIKEITQKYMNATSNLPCNIIGIVLSFCIGEPHTVKLKHNPLLKEIQMKYKYHYTKPLSIQLISEKVQHYLGVRIDYEIKRISINPSIIKHQKNKIYELLNRTRIEIHNELGLKYYYFRILLKISYDLFYNGILHTNLLENFVSRQTYQLDINVETLLENLYIKVLSNFGRAIVNIKSIQVKLELDMTCDKNAFFS